MTTTFLLASLAVMAFSVLILRQRRMRVSDLLIYLSLLLFLVAVGTKDPLEIPSLNVPPEDQLLAYVSIAMMLIYYKLKGDYRKELHDGLDNLRRDLAQEIQSLRKA